MVLCIQFWVNAVLQSRSDRAFSENKILISQNFVMVNSDVG